MIELKWTAVVKAGAPRLYEEPGELVIESGDVADFGLWASDDHRIAPEQEVRVSADVEAAGAGVTDVVLVWRRQVWNEVLQVYETAYHSQVQVGEVRGGGGSDVGGTYIPPEDAAAFRVLCQQYEGGGWASFEQVEAVIVDPYEAPVPVEPVATEVVRVYQPAGRGLPVLEVVDAETGEVIVAPPVGGDGLPGGGVWVTLGDGERVLVEGGLVEVVGG